MYKHLIRPVLFRIYPETIHEWVVGTIKTVCHIPGGAALLRALYRKSNPALEREVFGLKFNNPVGLAAGFDKNASFYNQFSNLGFGFIEIGTVTPKAQPGNPKPRSFRLPADKALINRMGFNNLGADAAVEQLKKRKPGMIIGGNIGKNTATPNCDAVTDYVYVFNKLYNYVDYFVVNVSCPNITNLKELQDKDALRQILQALQNERKSKPQRKPVLLKISSDLNFDQIDDVLGIVHETEIDGIVAANTSVSREGLQTPAERIAQIGNGGLSGAPLTERTTAIIRHIAQRTQGKLPIIGVGGIMSPQDALDKLEAGASLVQVYTGFIYEGPSLVKRICKAMIR